MSVKIGIGIFEVNWGTVISRKKYICDFLDLADILTLYTLLVYQQICNLLHGFVFINKNEIHRGLNLFQSAKSQVLFSFEFQ